MEFCNELDKQTAWTHHVSLYLTRTVWRKLYMWIARWKCRMLEKNMTHSPRQVKIREWKRKTKIDILYLFRKKKIGEKEIVYRSVLYIRWIKNVKISCKWKTSRNWNENFTTVSRDGKKKKTEEWSEKNKNAGNGDEEKREINKVK